MLFLGSAGCVQCHAVSGRANEMFSDFEMHVVGPGRDEDFGLEQITGDPADRYKFRTSPLRNAGVQPTFFHNGAFTRLEDAIRHRLTVADSAREYQAAAAGVDRDLRDRLGPVEPMLARVAPRLASPQFMRGDDFENLVAFVRTGLLDPRALPRHLCAMAPESLPSGLPPLQFQQCPAIPGAR